MVSKVKYKLLTLIIGIILLLGKDTRPRGIRNNNPANIRTSGAFTWSGQIGADSAGFAVFDSPVMGIRAATKLLITYANKYGLNTIEGVISRWAPPDENNTASYIQSVESRTGIDRESFLTVENYPALLKAIFHHESGVMPYTDLEIKQGVNAAYA
jgi:hypothetical protein